MVSVFIVHILDGVCQRIGSNIVTLPSRTLTLRCLFDITWCVTPHMVHHPIPPWPTRSGPIPSEPVVKEWPRIRGRSPGRNVSHVKDYTTTCLTGRKMRKSNDWLVPEHGAGPATIPEGHHNNAWRVLAESRPWFRCLCKHTNDIVVWPGLSRGPP